MTDADGNEMLMKPEYKSRPDYIIGDTTPPTVVRFGTFEFGPSWSGHLFVTETTEWRLVLTNPTIQDKKMGIIFPPISGSGAAQLLSMAVALTAILAF